MNLVVDASVIVKWYVHEVDTEAADRFYANSSYIFCVPAHAFGEVGNALATNIRRGIISRSRVPDIGSRLAESITVFPIEVLLPSAVESALDIGSTVYDAFYIALAVNLDTAVATADTRLVAATARSVWRDRVRHFAEFAR